VGCCDNGNKHLSSMKGGELFTVCFTVIVWKTQFRGVERVCVIAQLV
jgi:hypothetical protein